MAAGAETEFKFLFGERDSAKIKALVSAAAGGTRPDPQRLRAIYFDTPNQDLWKHGFILRVRSKGTSHIQTVKQMMSSSIHRGEWEAETGQFAPDLDLAKDTPLASLAARPSIRGALRPAFEVNVERTSYELEACGGVIEASVDRGMIEANGEKLGVRELELELKSGSPRALFNLARAFVSQALLHPSLIAKAERGHLLAEGVWGHPGKPSKPRLAKDMTCGEAFKEICRTCQHDFHLNLVGLEKADKVEAVHQGRVAIRRLRTAMLLFKPMVFDTSYRKIGGELKWLARTLGAARDLDVLHEAFLPRTVLDHVDAEARELTSHFEAERLRARQAAIEALNSERGRILLLDLAVWIEDGRWQRQASGIISEPIQRFSALHLKKRHKRLIRNGAGLAHLSPAQRHKVRIEAKELRYMAEFVAGVPGAAKHQKRLKTLIDCCETLQSALGAIRDAEAMAEFMERAASADAAAESETKTAMAQGHLPKVESGTEKELKKAVRSYLQLAAIDAF